MRAEVWEILEEVKCGKGLEGWLECKEERGERKLPGDRNIGQRQQQNVSVESRKDCVD